MLKFKRIDLFSRLSQPCYQCMESATLLCKTRGNPYVEIVHFINQLQLSQGTAYAAVVAHFHLDEDKLAVDLIKALNALPHGATSIMDFSDSIEIMVKEAFMACELIYKCPQINSAHLLLALKQHESLSKILVGISPEFNKINGDLLQEQLERIIAGSAEAGAQVSQLATTGDVVHSTVSATGQSLLGGSAGVLEQYTVDLTAKAAAGEIDEIWGRDQELHKVIDVLLRRRQNNPILTGEAGVGKTAVAEAFALRLARDEVPDALKGAKLLSLDLALLQAGAAMKGEFEKRLKDVIDAVKSSSTPIILFIDEAHTLIGAGGQAGQNDAANLLKPALARGELRCIAATTVKEYARYFEKDPALSRRFENILVAEPSFANACAMLQAMKSTLEQHHHVTILQEAIEAAVKLSSRYIPARQLPDKAVSVLDTACAKVALSQSAKPAAIEFLEQQLKGLERKRAILLDEDALGFRHLHEFAQLEEQFAKCTAELKEKQDKYRQCQELLQEYQKLKGIADAAASGLPEVLESSLHMGDEFSLLLMAEGIAPDCVQAADVSRVSSLVHEELRDIRQRLNALQEDGALLYPEVNAQAVSTVISEWTGIPLGRMMKNELNSLLNLEESLKQRVIGQDHVLAIIAKRMLSSRAALADPSRPIAVLMLAGPSGVGKTETAHALAEELYGTDDNLITINMSEFQEAHTVSTLKGAPPGYVGYGEGGVLTEAVRRRPYSVVLLDEIEKAHKDVHEMFFQIFDKGEMEDGEGRHVNFKNCVIILTTNVGDEVILDACADGDEDNLPDPEKLAKKLHQSLVKVFPEALLGRLQVVAYYPLFKHALRHIVELKLNKVVQRVQEQYEAKLLLRDSLYEEILSRCDNVGAGARLLDGIINNDLLPALSLKFMECLLEGKHLQSIEVGAKEHQYTFDFTFGK